MGDLLPVGVIPDYIMLNSRNVPDNQLGVPVVQDYAHAVGARLRDVRARRGLTLHGVEAKSAGRGRRWSWVSYERGDRAITVARLAELADFYGIPIENFFPIRRPSSSLKPTRDWSSICNCCPLYPRIRSVR